MNVSIVIPAYNAAETIAHTLDTLLAQTHSHWEAIVIDDGSTDATGKIAQRYVKRDRRFRMIRQPNSGESAARNAGIGLARNDWLLFLDADDWIAPVCLERLTAELALDPALDAVHCGHARVASDGTQAVETYQPPSGDMFPTLARRPAFPIHACIVRKSLVEAVGAFDRSLRTSADWDLWQRIARTGAIFGAVREVLAFYRMRPRSASLDAYQLFKDDLRVLRRGHAADARVPNPHPDYAHGMPEGRIQSQEFYLLSWCAGLLIGSGKDPLPLLEIVKTDHYAELYPEGVAESIFGAAVLPTCKAPHAWVTLWPAVERRLEEFLIALEKQSMAPDLAHRTLRTLKEMALKHSPPWQAIIEERDRAIEEGKGLLERLRQSEALLEVERDNWQRLAENRAQTIERQQALIERMQSEKASLQHEKERLLRSPDYRLGHFVLRRLRLRGLLAAVEHLRINVDHRLILARLAAEKWIAAACGRKRFLTTVCTNFPIYSQTFVYQEIVELARQGFDVRLVYSKLDSRDRLGGQFASLWKAKRRLGLHRAIHERDFAHYRARMPEKVEMLIEKLCEASGIARRDLVSHANFLQAFSFTRMVEAYRPDYLHSYFFYDRSLMALVASCLLDIPRGISCYADHLLKDYELKLVPLHLQLCDIVIATSERIKRELLAIAPGTEPHRIVVKPNGIDTKNFPVLKRSEPARGAPFRLVCVSRIEPKKGLLYLVDAVHLLRQRGLPVEAHLVGAADEWSSSSRDYKSKLDQRISELDLWGKVHLEGRQSLDGILRFLRISHLFIAPFVETENGDKDGIPTALMEAMATGLTVVATNAGSISEVIDEGRSGILVPQADSTALADGMEELLRDPERRRRLGEAAAEKIRRHLDIRVSEQSFHDRVQNIVKAPSRTAIRSAVLASLPK